MLRAFRPTADAREWGRKEGGFTTGGFARLIRKLLKEPGDESARVAANLRKSPYKARTVVHDVGFEVGSGEVVGLLGPNGAGKTTCFYMIVGLVRADGGRSPSTAPTSPTCRSTPARVGPVLPAAGDERVPQAHAWPRTSAPCSNWDLERRQIAGTRLENC